MIDIPPLILQPFVENAIWHGIVPKKTPGTIIIAIRLDGNSDRLICTIEDNGVGRAKAKEIQKQSFRKYKSYGTKLVSSRIEVLNELGYDIQLTTGDREEGGTIVKIKIDRKYD